LFERRVSGLRRQLRLYCNIRLTERHHLDRFHRGPYGLLHLGGVQGREGCQDEEEGGEGEGRGKKKIKRNHAQGEKS